MENVLNKTLDILNLTLLTYYLCLNVILLNCIHQTPHLCNIVPILRFILLQGDFLTLLFFRFSSFV